MRNLIYIISLCIMTAGLSACPRRSNETGAEAERTPPAQSAPQLGVPVKGPLGIGVNVKQSPPTASPAASPAGKPAAPAPVVKPGVNSEPAPASIQLPKELDYLELGTGMKRDPLPPTVLARYPAAQVSTDKSVLHDTSMPGQDVWYESFASTASNAELLTYYDGILLFKKYDAHPTLNEATRKSKGPFKAEYNLPSAGVTVHITSGGPFTAGKQRQFFVQTTQGTKSAAKVPAASATGKPVSTKPPGKSTAPGKPAPAVPPAPR